MSRHVLAAVLLFLMPSLAAARSGAPPGERVHHCDGNDADCAATTNLGCDQCHTAPRMHDGDATVVISDAGGPVDPATVGYVPDTDYSFVVTAVERMIGACQYDTTMDPCAAMQSFSGVCRFGFEMRATIDSSCGAATTFKAGLFDVSVDPMNTQFATCNPTPCPDDYVGHTSCGTLPDNFDDPTATEYTKTWSFDWHSPLAGEGAVRFNYAVNYADGNRNNQNDTPCFYTFLWDEGGASGDCELGVEPITFPPITPALPTLYSNTCGPGDVRLDPATTVATTPDTVATDTTDSAGPGAGGTLRLYQLRCGCSTGIHLTKTSGPSSVVRLSFF